MEITKVYLQCVHSLVVLVAHLVLSRRHHLRHCEVAQHREEERGPVAEQERQVQRRVALGEQLESKAKVLSLPEALYQTHF